MPGAFDAEMTETTFLPPGALPGQGADAWTHGDDTRGSELSECPKSDWNGGGHQEKRTEEVT